MSEQTAEYWDAEAAAFDDEPDHGLRGPATYAAWRDLLLPITGDRARVADLGCGTGTLSVLLAAAGHEVTGVDFSSRMVELARTKAVLAGVAAKPPLGAAAYDVVVSRHVLWAMPDTGAALDRWIGLLAPGGVLALIEGRWFTGAGLPRDECVRLVRERRLEADLTPLVDPAFWGGPIADDRYLLVSRR
jgi:SAM-dependent methyltransferase